MNGLQSDSKLHCQTTYNGMSGVNIELHCLGHEVSYLQSIQINVWNKLLPRPAVNGSFYFVQGYQPREHDTGRIVIEHRDEKGVLRKQEVENVVVGSVINNDENHLSYVAESVSRWRIVDEEGDEK